MAQKIIKVFRKIGNWEIGLMEYDNNQSKIFPFVRGTEYGENPIIYENNTVAYDRPERIPMSVINYMKQNAGKIRKELESYKNPELVEVPKYRTVYVQQTGSENVYYKDENGKLYYTKAISLKESMQGRDFSSENNGKGLEINESSLFETLNWNNKKSSLKKIQRISNGTIYEVLEEDNENYLIDRGPIVGQVYENKNKFRVL